ncbi:MAG TPA: class E sortase, partial [Ilumatobacteraceae bacterium]|nr:class E sortase [Ilumatobacteraceae bacterium]
VPAAAVVPTAPAAPASAATELVDTSAPDAAASTPAPIWVPPGRVKRNGKPKRRRRMNRWDRPPEPHDWRWAVGHIGRLLITVGLLMFGFVAYQLWGTGIETAQAQSRLDDDFDTYLVANGITPDTIAPAPPGEVVIPTIPTRPDPSQPSQPTTPDGPTITAAPAQVQDYGDVDPGDALMRLTIPAIDLDWKVVAGVANKDLAKGPGHFPDSPLPGQYGNAAIAGHRTGHGGPFFSLNELKRGDEIQIRTRIGGAYVYIVTGLEVVTPADYHVITDSNPDVATLTLVTCEPRYTSRNRLIVHAILDETRGSPVGEPLLFYGDPNPAPVTPVLPDDPGITDETDLSAVSAVSTPASALDPFSTDDIVTETTLAAVVTTAATTATTEAATTTTIADGSRPASQRDEFGTEAAFSQGWFDDGAAWPHVIGWGLALALIAIGAYQLAKFYRRLYLAFLVGAIPFVIVLYFFYENANRLLPAAI